MKPLSTNSTISARSSALEASRWATAVDPVGARLQLISAVAFLALLPIHHSARDWACGVYVLITLARLPRIAACYVPVFRHPIFYATAAYLIWLALGLLWAPDIALGLDDIKTHRMLLIPILLWPILSYFYTLVMAYLAGVAVLNGIQLVQWWTDPSSERFGGFSNEIQAGLYCAVAACIWVQVFVTSRCRARQLWIPACALLLAFTGLLLSGSRAPIAAVVILIPSSMVVCFISYPMLRRRVVLVSLLICIAVLPAGIIKWDYITFRFSKAAEVYSEGGLRGEMIDQGLATFLGRPFLGTGTGNASRDMPEGLNLHGMRGGDITFHCTYVFALATLGIPGLLLLLNMLATGLWQSLPRSTGPPLMYAIFFSLSIWCFAAWFDSYQASGSYLSVLGMLLAFAMIGRGSRQQGDFSNISLFPPAASSKCIDG